MARFVGRLFGRRLGFQRRLVGRLGRFVRRLGWLIGRIFGRLGFQRRLERRRLLLFAWH
jgi:hypothetical protein